MSKPPVVEKSVTGVQSGVFVHVPALGFIKDFMLRLTDVEFCKRLNVPLEALRAAQENV